ncbi:nitroreductase family protein [Galbitalea sp. SE-J8]|uniref:nitroreductase family protein n=1 Tax=Galbitalea sp. SE-J8 TaxID=3054952 RepID=UPI00259C782D|nr:nitroreductase family protein [Galbitalea sp. SE-J8]MDM4763748.1 nitroreductase family protein [Galbitalea sp. SE-J8]
MTALEAALRRRSQSKVTDAAPDHAELARYVAAAASVADHSGLRPWRLIELRGDARRRLGDAFVAASGLEGPHAEKLAAKPLRASLLVAVVATIQPSFKVPDWEQEAVASGVAHLLSLVLDEAGWGVMWRTGGHTRAPEVAVMHGLRENERLLGWLYVGGVPERERSDRVRRFDADAVLTVLE